METIENEYARFWFENGVLFSELKEPIEFDVKIVSNLIELRHKISNSTNQYWCMDGTKLVSLNKEARDYAEIHGQDFIYANAMIVNSHVTKFIFCMYVKLKSPGFPFQVFTNREKAVEWLLEIKSKNEEKIENERIGK
ncbi:hypothetical protein AAGV28_00385 [Flavobacterium sp. FZUC8N2.13]|uniref:DUF7793 domain-containing protein n=1 Tax=Flavobacterium zubiriense TaxID=3138075 RepID=A0ABV4TA62_9FLAO